MAKHTQKNDALGMFSKTKPVNIKKSTPVEKEPEQVIEINKSENEKKVSAQVVPETVNETSVAAVESEHFTSSNTSKINLDMKPAKKERIYNTRSFYLKDETYNKLVARAKKNDAGISEYLEFILGQIL